MTKFEEIFYAIQAEASANDMTVEEFSETPEGREMSGEYYVEISRAAGSPSAMQELEARFNDLMEITDAAISGDDYTDTERTPYDMLTDKAKELLAAGTVASFTEGVELASRRLPDVANRHVEWMRSGR